MQLTRHSQHTLTHIERKGLQTVINLADGHARRDPVLAEQPVLQSLQDIYDLSLKYDALDLEDKLVNSYLGLSGQKLPNYAQPLVFFSASEAISVAARVLAECQESCAVLEPTFDSIPMLLGAAGVPTSPFKEELLYQPEALAKEISHCTAIFVTLPNNPTGLTLDEDAFRRLCEVCEKTNKSLIIDACFRMFAQPAHFNYYQILVDSGIDWMVIEDTGKVWAANGLKAGILVCSDKYAPGGSKAFHELVLSISPFILTLLWQLSERAGARAIEEIRHLIDSNRAIVRSSISGSRIFYPDTTEIQLPVEAVFYDRVRFPYQSKLVSLLQERGLAVVGSESFYWSSGAHRPFLRLALSRPEGTVRQGVELLATFQ